MPTSDFRPEFSVVVPVYNATAVIGYFRFCVESILAQSFGGFELIFVDDLSSDDSVDLLEEYARRDERVRVRRLKTKHYIGTPRNVGTEMARGNYVVYVDYDDYLYPDALERLHRLADKNAQPHIILFGHRNLSYEHPSTGWLEEQRALPWWRRLRAPGRLDGKQALKKFLLGHLAIPPWSRALRADIAKQISFPDIWAEDLPHALESYAVADTALVIKERLYAHLVRPNSGETSHRGKRHFDSLVKNYEYTEAIARQKGIDQIFPGQYRYFRLWRLLIISGVLRGYEHSNEDLLAWHQLAVEAVTPELLNYHLLSGLWRSRYGLRKSQVKDYQTLKDACRRLGYT